MQTGSDPSIYLAFAFGVLFLTTLLGIGVWVKNPSDFLSMVGRIVCALAAAGVTATMPGLFKATLSTTTYGFTFGGALLVFGTVYFFNPPERIAGPQPSNAPAFNQLLFTPRTGLQFRQGDAILPIQQKSDGTLIVNLKRAPFIIALPKRNRLAPSDEFPELRITASADAKLFDRADFEKHPNDNPFFWPGTEAADYTYGSASLFAESDASGDHFLHTYITADRLNIEDESTRGCLVSAIKEASDQERDLLQRSQEVFLVVTLQRSARIAFAPRENIYSNDVDLIKLNFRS